MDQDDNSYVIILLKKYIEGNISYSEKQKLFDLLFFKENEGKIKDYILSHLDNFEVDNWIKEKVDSGKIFSKVLSELKLDKSPRRISFIKSEGPVRIRRIILRTATIAASLIISFYLGGLYSAKIKGNDPESVSTTAFNEIRAPLGSNSEITLPDGTHIMLNAGSLLRYRSDYNTDNRDIFLTGEAYFKVARNIELPLNVNAGKIKVKAVGTEFNIKAYEEEGTIETTLVDGKVEITQQGQDEDKGKIIDLGPNQKATYIKETKNLTIAEIKDYEEVIEPVRTFNDNMFISPEVDVNQVVAWTEGKLIFRSESLERMCVELQRKYDVKFVFGDEEIKKFRFSGVLLDETLEQVLNVIKLTAPIKHYVEGKSVFMSTDRDQLNNFSKHLK